DVGDFLLDQEDQRVVEINGHGVLVVDEVGGEVAAVELHTFHNGKLVLQAVAVFHGNDAFLAHFVHRFGDDGADAFVAVGGNGADLGDGLAGFTGGGELAELGDDGGDALVDAALEI